MSGDYKEMFDRLSPRTQESVRYDLLGQLQGCLQEISKERYELLRARSKIQSVLKQVLEQKRDANLRPMWGSW